MRSIYNASKIVLITGASSGIGAEFTKIFAQEGFSLILVAQHKEKLESFSKEIQKQYNVRVKSFASDLSKRKSSEDIFQELNKYGLEVNILVNNAGVGCYGKFIERDFVNHTNLLNINVLAPLYLTHLLLPQMLERNEGKILNVASTAAFRPGPLMSTYNASKAFILSWSQALSEELKNTNITVTAVCPGPTLTGFQKKALMRNTELSITSLPNASDVARIGYTALIRGKDVVIIGLKNKFIVFFEKFLPFKFIKNLDIFFYFRK